MTIASVDATYERHSHHDEYEAANRAFVDGQTLGHVERFLDIACGDGAVCEMLLARAPGAFLCGVDIDPVQIDLITRRFQGLGYEVRRGTAPTSDVVNGRPVLTFAVGAAEDLDLPAQAFDCVTITNAIHMVPDKPAFIAAVARTVRHGGLFGFNTVFYAGTMPDDTHEFYMDWLKRSLAYIEALNADRRERGEPPIKKQRGDRRKAFQNVWMSPADWTELLERNGLRPHVVHEREKLLDAEFFASAGSYGGLAEVLLAGYPVEVSSKALGATAAEAMAARGTDRIPRRWLEIWATRD